MKDDTMIYVGLGLVAAYLLLKPKPATAITTPIVHTPIPAGNNSGTLITQGGSILNNLVDNIFGNGNSTPTPDTPSNNTPSAADLSNFWNFGNSFNSSSGDTGSIDEWA